MLTPKQKDIYDFVKRFGKRDPVTAFDVGIHFGQPRKKAESWAKPALKELVKQKIVARNGDAYTKQPEEQNSIH